MKGVRLICWVFIFDKLMNWTRQSLLKMNAKLPSKYSVLFQQAFNTCMGDMGVYGA